VVARAGIMGAFHPRDTHQRAPAGGDEALAGGRDSAGASI